MSWPDPEAGVLLPLAPGPEAGQGPVLGAGAGPGLGLDPGLGVALDQGDLALPVVTQWILLQQLLKKQDCCLRLGS